MSKHSIAKSEQGQEYYEDIIIQPILSEKANILREEGKYVFKVAMSANKTSIKEAVHKLFNVHPISCNVMVVSGKPKKVRYRKGYTSTWKKAIVKIPKEEKISVFEGV